MNKITNRFLSFEILEIEKKFQHRTIVDASFDSTFIAENIRKACVIGVNWVLHASWIQTYQQSNLFVMCYSL